MTGDRALAAALAILLFGCAATAARAQQTPADDSQPPSRTAISAQSTQEQQDAFLEALAERLERDGFAATRGEVEALIDRSDLPPAFRSRVLRAAVEATRRARNPDFQETAERAYVALVDQLADSDERSILIEVMRNIGALSIYLEDYAQAVDFSRQAIDAFGPEHRDTPGTYSSLAAALVELDRSTEAMTALETGIAIAEQQGRPSASLTNNLGYMQHEQGELEAALATFEKTAELNRANGDTASLAISRQHAGDLL